MNSETIRRKIIAGEPGAVEVSGKIRKQSRVAAADLSASPSPERAAQLFGVGAGLRAVEDAFAAYSPETVDTDIA